MKNSVIKSIFSIVVLVIGILIILYTALNKYVVICLSLITILLIWLKKKHKFLKLLPFIPVLIFLFLLFNYFVLEPRVFALNYLANKYDFPKEEIQIKQISFMCESEGATTQKKPCISVELEYEPYEIQLTKSTKGWKDIVYYDGVSVELETDDSTDTSFRKQMNRDIINVLESYDAQYKRYNYDKNKPIEDGYYYYLIKVTEAKDLENITIDIKKKLQNHYNNASRYGALESLSYFINLSYTKDDEVYEKYEQLIASWVMTDENTRTVTGKNATYTEILNVENTLTINSEEFYQFNPEFLNFYERPIGTQQYDFIQNTVTFAGNIKNGIDSEVADRYTIKGVNVSEWVR